MNKLIEILEDIQPGIDYTTCTDLIDGRRISSLSIISLVVELEDAFDITIPAVEIIPANFNSAQSLWQMIVRLQEEG
ncbi:MAG TPA: acyl carrier protein [Candidatus Scybalocola faecipullorum]|nr:acyl carrier protein [Candidatus Scybalocola faecipullorum]